MTIRAARPADAPRLEAIARSAYAKYVSRIGRDPAPMSADYAGGIAAGHAIVISIGSLVAGYLIGRGNADGYFIENVAVDPAFQGQGLGGMMLRLAISEARRLRLPALRLFTNAAMTENLALYAHLGFVETHRAVEQGYDRVYMRLSI